MGWEVDKEGGIPVLPNLRFVFVLVGRTLLTLANSYELLIYSQHFATKLMSLRGIH